MDAADGWKNPVDTATALVWLAQHQRLPEDSSQDVIDGLNEVRKHFIEHPDPRCIPLLLGVFEDHMGWGIFQVCDAVLRKYSQKQLTPHLKDALRSDSRGVRWWATHWALDFEAPELVPELEMILNSPEDEDAHYYAIAALAEIYLRTRDANILTLLRKRALVETDPQRQELFRESLEEFGQ